jgi:hypothetical protein
MRYLVALMAGFGMLLGGFAAAHPMLNSVVLLDLLGDSVRAEVQIPVSELGLATKLNLQASDALEVNKSALETYLESHIQASSADGAAWTVAVNGLEAATEQGANGAYRELVARLTLTPPIGADPRAFTLRFDAVVREVRDHIALVSVRQDWGAGITPELGATTVGAIRVDPATDTVAPLEINRSGDNSLWRGFVGMVRVGLAHIAGGTDHLLFLLTLLLPAVVRAARGRWAGAAGVRASLLGILKIVTAFTVGHSLTLILGAVLHLNIPAQPIEALIALSILVGAVHALRPIFPGREVWVAAGFGLVHGMAFSMTLAELHLSTGQMALSLLGFNLGIEAMQLLVIAVTIPWLLLLARTRLYRGVQVTGAVIAGVAALGWLLERLGQPNALGDLAGALSPYGAWVIVALAVVAVAATGAQRLRPNLVRS